MYVRGKARLDKRTKNLVNRLKKSDIAIINHDDIDEVSAKSLIEIRPQAIVNALPSLTGRYPAPGVYKIIKAGIPVIDNVGGGIFDLVREGTILELKDGQVYAGGKLVARGKLLNQFEVAAKMKSARENMREELDSFVVNTLDYARREKDILLDEIELPELKTKIENRHVLIVVRGHHYTEDLRAIKGYMEDERPVMIGVDGGADALLESGFVPDIIVGDMDSVSDRALQCGAEIIVHAYPNGKAPGLPRVEEMNVPAMVLAMPGTSEDVAMILAHDKGASLIVAVGTHSNIIDFMEKGRKGMASTFLVRLKVGSILVDAKGVSQLYRQSVRAKYLLQLFVASMVPIFILLWVAPTTKPFLRLLFLQLKLFFNI
ncbi:MAG: putative cytokinetic ring protein SteA [Candidatus Saccharibacteria bacterium]